jgi:hypothetical protein
MALIKALHIQCDGCRTVLHNADWGKWIQQRRALRAARRRGWTHGKRGDLCPQCQPRPASQTKAPRA